MSSFLQYSILSRTRGAAIIECQDSARALELRAWTFQPKALYDTYGPVFYHTPQHEVRYKTGFGSILLLTNGRNDRPTAVWAISPEENRLGVQGN